MAKSMSECLDAAADLIEKTGWTQHGFGNLIQPVGPHCMIGACRVVCPDRAQQGSYVFANALGFRGTSSAANAFDWNDWKKRTKEEVTTRLRKYAAIAKRKEDAAARTKET